MKELRYLGIVFMTVLLSSCLVSCSNSDNEEEQKESSVNFETLMIGKWKALWISLSEDGLQNFDVNDESFKNKNGEEVNPDKYYEFTSDNTGYVIYEDDNDRLDFTWGVIDNKLSLQTLYNGSRVYKILKYSKKVVLLEYYSSNNTETYYLKLVRSN